jgi:GTPase KRas
METFKTIVMGDTGVGKSAFIIRFIQGNFVGDYDPTIEDSYRKEIEVNKKKCILDILDTHASEEYNAMNGRYFRIAQAAIISYSITDEKSFLSVESIAESFIKNQDSDEYILFIVGMKCDAEDKRAVSYEAGKEISQKFKAKGFFEASSLNNINVLEIFANMASTLMSYENSEWEETAITIKKKSGCWIL